jgi:hypothetical protein
LPDGSFSYQKSLGIENIGIFDDHLEYFTAIWCILRPFGIFYGHLVYFTAIWYILRPFGIFYGHLVYFTAIWYILRPFGIFYGHLAYFTAIWYILWPFGIILWPFGTFFPFPFRYVWTKKKSGNPAPALSPIFHSRPQPCWPIHMS